MARSHGHQQDQHQPCDLGEEHESTLVEAIDDDAGDHPEEQVRDCVQRKGDTRGKGGVGGAVHEPREGDVVEAVAELRDELPGPEEQEVAVGPERRAWRLFTYPLDRLLVHSCPPARLDTAARRQRRAGKSARPRSSRVSRSPSGGRRNGFGAVVVTVFRFDQAAAQVLPIVTCVVQTDNADRHLVHAGQRRCRSGTRSALLASGQINRQPNYIGSNEANLRSRACIRPSGFTQSGFTSTREVSPSIAINILEGVLAALVMALAAGGGSRKVH